MKYITNAVIERADLQFGRGVFLEVVLTLDFGGYSQGFGGHVLYIAKGSQNHKASLAKNYAGAYISRILEVAGAHSWSELEGKTIRVEKISEVGAIKSIGHIVKDDWFNPDETFQAMSNDEEIPSATTK